MSKNHKVDFYYYNNLLVCWLMIAVFANSPFDDELRIECKMLKINTQAYGEVAILENYSKSIFDVKDTIVEIQNGDKKAQVQIIGKAIVKIENNTINIFGAYEKLV